MTQNISAFGLTVIIRADKSFPLGFPVTQFADDADPLGFGAVTIAQTAMGLNGDQLTWAQAQQMPMALNVIPGSADDVNLQIIADNNRVSQNKQSLNDVITAVVTYPDGSVVTLSGGKMVSSEFGRSVSSAGRQKTKSYAFSFQSKA